MPTSSVLVLIIATVCAAGGQLLFKVGAQGRTEWLAFLNAYIFAGLILYVVGTMLWIYALSFEKLVNVYAFTALTFVLVLVFGVLLLGERLAAPGIVGIGLVLAGLYLLITYNA